MTGVRAVEARRSAGPGRTAAGKEDVELDEFRECYFPYVAADIKDEFERLKARTNPDIVFAHRNDGHAPRSPGPVADLTWNTFRNHLVLQYEIPKYEGDLGKPGVPVLLPLRTGRSAKAQLPQEHFPSQRHRTWFHPDTFHGLMSVRGVECNATERRAEAFYTRKLVL